MSQVSEMLAEAKKLIESPEKWIKGQMCDGDCFCAAGALIAVGSFEEGEGKTYKTYWKARMAMTSIIAEITPSTCFGPSITRFNDDPKTTHEDIMNLFDMAIERSK